MNTTDITIDQLTVQRLADAYCVVVMESGRVNKVLMGTARPTEAQCQSMLDQMRRCRECFHVALHGGPGHEPSQLCRMGRTRPHCSCAACY